MADDLDDFLKQAAERRKQRQRQKEGRAPLEQLAPPTPTFAPPPVMEPLEQRHLPTFDSRPSNAPQPMAPIEPIVVAEVIEEPSRLRSQFDAQPKKQKKQKQTQPQAQSSSLSPQASTTDMPAQATSQRVAQVSSSSIIQALRDPKSMRTAIIVHEILKRPWQE